MRRLHLIREHARRTGSASRGMSFIEVLVWISVFTFAMVALSSTLIAFYRSNEYTIEQGLAVESARRGITQAIGEMREMQYASDGAYPIVSMSSTSLEFYSDVDADPEIERVRYEIDGTNFTRYVLDPSGDPLAYTGSESSSIVSDEVRNLEDGVTVFTYYDADGNQITDYSKTEDVRFIRMDLVVNVNPSRLPNELTLRSSAALRNLVGK